VPAQAEEGEFMMRLALAIAAALAGPALAQDVAPLRKIGIYVTPYYNSDDGGRVVVAVDRKFDTLLASSDPADVLKVRDMVAAQPGPVAPNTLMVLASRLYDVGERDEAVFWFYAARYRFLTLLGVLDDGRFGEANTATRAFVELAGPAINGYAFCNLEKQDQAERKAIAWVTANPYDVLMNSRFRARPGDRQANLANALQRIGRIQDDQRVGLANPESRAALMKARAEAQADARFCW
jgi:hypothetical protein